MNSVFICHTRCIQLQALCILKYFRLHSWLLYSVLFLHWLLIYKSVLHYHKLLLWRVLSGFTCWFYNMVTLILRLVSPDFGTCSYQRFFHYYFYYYYSSIQYAIFYCLLYVICELMHGRNLFSYYVSKYFVPYRWKLWSSGATGPRNTV